MEAKRFLEQYGLQYMKVLRLRKEIDALDDLFSITQDMTAEKVQRSPKPDRIGEIIAKKADKEEELKAEEKRAEDIMGEIEDVISRVSREKLRFLLVMRYINFMRWREIEDVLGYDSQQRWVHKLHGRALNEVERIINDL